MIELPKCTGEVIKTPARIRLEREMEGAGLPEKVIKLIKIDYDLMEVSVCIFPDEGPFKDSAVDFLIKIPASYPHSPPKAQIMQKLFHPNFDYEGHVCLNILRLDWNPVLSISAILFGLLSILLNPEGEEPLNQVAGEMLLKDPEGYYKLARECALGGSFNGIKFDNIIIDSKK